MAPCWQSLISLHLLICLHDMKYQFQGFQNSNYYLRQCVVSKRPNFYKNLHFHRDKNNLKWKGFSVNPAGSVEILSQNHKQISISIKFENKIHLGFNFTFYTFDMSYSRWRCVYDHLSIRSIKEKGKRRKFCGKLE